jgi:hypothetical protein
MTFREGLLRFVYALTVSLLGGGVAVWMMNQRWAEWMVP